MTGPGLCMCSTASLPATEIVAEQEEGFVVVASTDMSLREIPQKIRDFSVEVRGSASVARIHEIDTDASRSDRLGRILSDSLMASWSSLEDEQIYIVDAGISCNGTWQI